MSIVEIISVFILIGGFLFSLLYIEKKRRQIYIESLKLQNEFYIVSTELNKLKINGIGKH